MSLTAPAGPRTPVHVVGDLLSTRRVGAFHYLTIGAPGIAQRFRPGTFVALSIGGPLGSSVSTTHLARRGYWIRRVTQVGGYPAGVEIVVQPDGAAGRWLASLEPGAHLEVTGPLGRPFALPQDQVSCLLVGEGYATAALFTVAERLRERNCPVLHLVGARDEQHLVPVVESRRRSGSVVVVTTDGSAGQPGQVVDLLEEMLDRSAADVVYAAGSLATLRAVASAAARYGAWSQTALEQPSACGTGLCQGCAVPVLGADGSGRLVRACADGPVFRGDRVRWDNLIANQVRR